MSLTQALWALGCAVGSQIGGYSGAKLGRKATLIANNFFIIPGTLLQVSFYGLPILWLIIYAINFFHDLCHISCHKFYGALSSSRL